VIHYTWKFVLFIIITYSCDAFREGWSPSNHTFWTAVRMSKRPSKSVTMVIVAMGTTNIHKEMRFDLL